MKRIEEVTDHAIERVLFPTEAMEARAWEVANAFLVTKREEFGTWKKGKRILPPKEVVVIRTGERNLNRAIGRALALGNEGELAQIDLVK